MKEVIIKATPPPVGHFFRNFEPTVIIFSGFVIDIKKYFTQNLVPLPPHFPPFWGKNRFSESENDENSKSISSYSFEGRATIFYGYSQCGLGYSPTEGFFDICLHKNVMGDRKFDIFGLQKTHFFRLWPPVNFFRAKYQKNPLLGCSQDISEDSCKKIMVLSSKL